MNTSIIAANALTMSSREIAELVNKEHGHVMRDIRTMLESLGKDQSNFADIFLDSYGRSQPCFSLPKRETLILVSGYDVQMRATIIDRWQELEQQVPQLADKDKFDMSLKLVQVAMETLNMAPSGRLLLLKQVEGNFGLPPALPNYAADNNSQSEASMQAKSLTELLSEHGSKVSARKANSTLLEMGYLKEMSRPSTVTPNKVKHFKTVDGDGLKYGKNMTSPNNPREIQPLWYVETFSELLSLITNHKESK